MQRILPGFIPLFFWIGDFNYIYIYIFVGVCFFIRLQLNLICAGSMVNLDLGPFSNTLGSKLVVGESKIDIQLPGATMLVLT